jgi:hypothetical protein
MTGAEGVMMGTDDLLQKMIKIGSVAGALAAILGVIFLLFPQFRPTVATSKAVTFTDIRVESVSTTSSGPCDSFAAVSLKVQIAGYENKVLSLFDRLDESATTNAQTSLCAPPLGRWDDWHVVDLTPGLRASAESELFPVEFQVGVPWRADNWKIKLKVTDSKGDVLGTADTPLFNIR